MSMSAGGSHQSGSQSLDQDTKNRLGSIWGNYQQAGQQGPGPVLTGAVNYGQGLQGAGQTGYNALSGDPQAAQRLMNPFQGQVINAMNAQLDRANQIGTQNLNSAATQAGAFGGSRQGVAEGNMLSNNALNANSQIANLLQGGYGQAMNQAGQLANLGLSGSYLNSNLGMQGVGNQALWNAQQQRQGFVMPTGQNFSSTGFDAKAGFNPFNPFGGFAPSPNG